MIYIYDQIVDKNQMDFEYLGNEYHLKGVTKTGNSYYLTYMAKDKEPILVMPLFATQFLEAAKKFDKIKDCTTDHNVRLRIKRAFRVDPIVDEYQLGGVTTYHYTVDFKSIQIFMTLLVKESEKKARFFLQPAFTIMKDNIFGTGFDVDVRENEQLYKYCSED